MKATDEINEAWIRSLDERTMDGHDTRRLIQMALTCLDRINRPSAYDAFQAVADVRKALGAADLESLGSAVDRAIDARDAALQEKAAALAALGADRLRYHKMVADHKARLLQYINDDEKLRGEKFAVESERDRLRADLVVEVGRVDSFQAALADLHRILAPRKGEALNAAARRVAAMAQRVASPKVLLDILGAREGQGILPRAKEVMAELQRFRKASGALGLDIETPDVGGGGSPLAYTADPESALCDDWGPSGPCGLPGGHEGLHESEDFVWCRKEDITALLAEHEASIRFGHSYMSESGVVKLPTDVRAWLKRLPDVVTFAGYPDGTLLLIPEAILRTWGPQPECAASQENNTTLYCVKPRGHEGPHEDPEWGTTWTDEPAPTATQEDPP